MQRENMNKSHLYMITFASSLMISWLAYTQSDIINGDGILYITTAQHYITGGLADAFSIFKWPFYGILIGSITRLTQLPLEVSAHVLNSILIGISCVSFVAIYDETGYKDARPWVAAILILSLPILNDYRAFVIRDFGYWAFTLTSILFFIKLVKKQSLLYALAWQITALTAIAFRIEAVVFLAAPFIYFLVGKDPVRVKILTIFEASFLFIILLLIAASTLVYVGTTSTNQGMFALWLSYASPISIVDGIHAEAIELREQLEFLSSTGEAATVLVGGLASLAIIKIGANSVPAYLIIAGYGHIGGWLKPNPVTRLLLLFLLLALLTVSAIVASQYFLSSRYTVLTTLIICLITFPYVDRILQKLAQMNRSYWSAIAWAFIFVLFLDGIISGGASKAPIKSGALWALENIGREKPWLCNEFRIQFYTNDRCVFIEREHLLSMLGSAQPHSEYGHLLLWIGRKDESLSDAVNKNNGLHLLEVQENKKGGRLAIYSTISPRSPDH